MQKCIQHNSKSVLTLRVDLLFRTHFLREIKRRVKFGNKINYSTSKQQATIYTSYRLVKIQGLMKLLSNIPSSCFRREEILMSNTFSEEGFKLHQVLTLEKVYREFHLLHYSDHIFWIIVGQTLSIMDRCLHSTIHSTNIYSHPYTNHC